MRLLLFLFCVAHAVLNDDGFLANCTLNESNRTFPCKLALFSAFVPNMTKEIVLGNSQYGCEPFEYANVIVLLDRGGCTFEDKVKNAKNAFGIALVNSDNTLFAMGVNDYLNTTKIAFTVAKADGTWIRSRAATSTISVASKHSEYEQCWQKVSHLIQLNNPLAAVFSYYDCAGALVNKVQGIYLLRHNVMAETYSMEKVTFLLKIGAMMPMHWEITKRLGCDAILNAMVLLDRNCAVNRKDILQGWSRLGDCLAGQGYLQEAILCYEQVACMDKTNRHGKYKLAVVLLASGRILESLKLVNSFSQPEKIFTKNSALWLPEEILYRLLNHNMSSTDFTCLEAASTSNSSHANTCCKLNYEFTSSFSKELFYGMTQLGVFLDEFGAYNESVYYFKQAYQFCGPQTGLEDRIAYAVPIVFNEKSAMQNFIRGLENNHAALLDTIASADHLMSSLDIESSLDGPYAKETAAYLSWTITPPTMFLGYQGMNVKHIKENIARLYLDQNTKFQSKELLVKEKPRVEGKKRIGFVSSWFRNHSVGKLLKGIVRNINRKKFHVIILSATHFFKSGDDLTRQFRMWAAEFIELSPLLSDAKKEITALSLDVLIYPEIGMDAWIYYLAHARLAPIQCMFWGHPITSGLTSIDYYVISEHFIADFDDASKVIEKDLEYAGVEYTEQIVLFTTLSTYFGKPKHTIQSNARSRLHLPLNGKLYVCPQTLMKFHVDFDVVLREILFRDPNAYIILLFSEQQAGWKEKLIFRFQTTINSPKDYMRILFYEKLSHPDFIGLLQEADVVLDPFPFGGGVTTLDAFSANSPVVAFPAMQTVVQLAAGFYRYMEIYDCIVDSVAKYIDLSIRLANDIEFHNEIVAKIQARSHLVFEDVTTTAEWEKFLLSVSP